jgi:hypothetical protein
MKSKTHTESQAESIKRKIEQSLELLNKADSAIKDVKARAYDTSQAYGFLNATAEAVVLTKSLLLDARYIACREAEQSNEQEKRD